MAGWRVRVGVDSGIEVKAETLLEGNSRISVESAQVKRRASKPRRRGRSGAARPNMPGSRSCLCTPASAIGMRRTVRRDGFGDALGREASGCAGFVDCSIKIGSRDWSRPPPSQPRTNSSQTKQNRNN